MIGCENMKNGDIRKQSQTGTYNFGFGDMEYQSNKIGRFPANLLVSGNILDVGIKHSSKQTNVGNTGTFKGIFKNNVHDTSDRIGGFDDTCDFSDYFSLDRWFRKQLAVLPPETRQQLLIFFDDWF